MRTFKLYLAFLAILFTTNVNAGSFDWAKQYCHDTRGDYPSKILSDRFGNIYVGGLSIGCQTCYEGYFSKYDSLGIEIFTKYVGYSSMAKISSFDLDYSGNMYLAVNINDAEAYIDSYHLIDSSGVGGWTAIIKLNTLGNVVWYRNVPNSSDIKLSVDSLGSIFALKGDSLKNISTNGLTNWTIPIVGSNIETKGNNLVVYSSTRINILSKTTGSILNFVNVANCSDLKVTYSGEIYYTGSAGTSKLVNLATSWNSPGLIYEKLALGVNGVWLGRTLKNVSSYKDSSLIVNINFSGVVQLSDTIFNSDLMQITTTQEGKPIIIGNYASMQLSNYSTPALFKPYLIENDLNIGFAGNGIIMGRYNPNLIAKIGFTNLIWDSNNDYDGYWSNYSKQCPGGTPFNLNYRLYDGTFQPGSVVFAELSDVNGQFVNPTVIGANSPSGVTGVISCQLPSSLLASNQYVIRLRATGPSITSLQVSHSLGIASPISTISLSGNSPTFCSKTEKFTVTSSGSNDTYSWQRNGVDLSSSSTTYSPTSSGTYRCITTDTWGCSKLSNNQIAVTVKALPNAAINYSGNKEICNSDTLQLAVPLVAGNSYQWYKGVAAISGQTSNAYNTNITGNYKVTVTGSNGCSKTSSVLKLSVYKPLIQAFGPTTFCNGGNVVLGISSGTTNSWQWMKNNVNISGANNQYYVATKTGYYKAATTNSNGCTGVSANIVVTVNCREGEIENEFNTKLQAYPNPINDRVTIEGAAISAEGTIDVFDITGRKVDVDIESIQDGMATLNCSTLNDGIYILNFVKELGTIETIKLIKQ